MTCADWVNVDRPTADSKGSPAAVLKMQQHTCQQVKISEHHREVDTQLHNSDSLIETDASSEPANSQASSGYSRGNTGSEALNCPLAAENHSTHAKATHESVMQGSCDEMQSGIGEDQLAPCHSPDTVIPSPVSHTTQHGGKISNKIKWDWPAARIFEIICCCSGYSKSPNPPRG